MYSGACVLRDVKVSFGPFTHPSTILSTLANENLWERRWHPLREEWVVYAAHRNTRPWTTGTLASVNKTEPPYDPACHLCPGNTRVHGDVNTNYEQVFIFDNDHPAVGLEAPDIHEATSDGLYKREPAVGIARVICYSPLHNLTLADLDDDHILNIMLAWQAQMQDLGPRPEIAEVLIFENCGKAVGVSNPHPHGQIYATNFIFHGTADEVRLAAKHRLEKGRNLFADIIEAEIKDGRRILTENDQAIAFIPFFAQYAYETMIFPRERHATLLTMSKVELRGLASALGKVVRGYNKLAGEPFPYVMTLHQAPVDGGSYGEHHTFIWLMPPLRAPGLLKYLGGPESGMRNFMADTMPELKAAELRGFIE